MTPSRKKHPTQSRQTALDLDWGQKEELKPRYANVKNGERRNTQPGSLLGKKTEKKLSVNYIRKSWINKKLPT